MRVQPLGPDLQEALRDLARGHPAHGLVAAAANEGEIVWQHQEGAPAEQYRIGSITKTFTAVLVMRLRDEGALALDDRIGAHLPDTPHRDATIRALLSHSSGLTAEPSGPWWERSDGVSWAELVQRNADAPQVFPPRLRYHYSNLSYGILGELVARLRGRSWWSCVVDELTSPLSLGDTTYLPQPGAAIGTSIDPDSRQTVAEHVVETGAMAPAGQLWSTAPDLARWLDFLAGARPDILAPATLTEMATVQAADPDDQHRGAYGLGLRLAWTAHGTLRGHTGSMPGFLAAAFVEPRTRVSAVVLASATTGVSIETIASTMIRKVLDHQSDLHAGGGVGPAELPQTGPDDELSGFWHHGNTRYRLARTDDGFALHTQPGDSSWRFRATGADRYRGLNGYPAGEELSVVRRPDGTVSHLEVVTFVLTRVPYDPAAPMSGEPPTPISSPG